MGYCWGTGKRKRSGRKNRRASQCGDKSTIQTNSATAPARGEARSPQFPSRDCVPKPFAPAKDVIISARRATSNSPTIPSRTIPTRRTTHQRSPGVAQKSLRARNTPKPKSAKNKITFPQKPQQKRKSHPRCCARGAPRAQHHPRDEELPMRRKSVSTQPSILSTHPSAPLPALNLSNGRHGVKYRIPIKPNHPRRFGVVTGSKTVGSMSVQCRLRHGSGSVLCRFGAGFFAQFQSRLKFKHCRNNNLYLWPRLSPVANKNFTHFAPPRPNVEKCPELSQPITPILILPWSLGLGALLAIGPWSFSSRQPTAYCLLFPLHFGAIQGSKRGGSTSVWGDSREVGGPLRYRFRVAFPTRINRLLEHKHRPHQHLNSPPIISAGPITFFARTCAPKNRIPSVPLLLPSIALVPSCPRASMPVPPFQCPKMSRNVPIQTTHSNFLLPSQPTIGHWDSVRCWPPVLGHSPFALGHWTVMRCWSPVLGHSPLVLGHWDLVLCWPLGLGHSPSTHCHWNVRVCWPHQARIRLGQSFAHPLPLPNTQTPPLGLHPLLHRLHLALDHPALPLPIIDLDRAIHPVAIHRQRLLAPLNHRHHLPPLPFNTRPHRTKLVRQARPLHHRQRPRHVLPDTLTLAHRKQTKLSNRRHD